MSKRVERVTELSVLIKTIESEIPDVFEPDEGDVFYSKREDMIVVIYKVCEQFISAYVEGSARKFKHSQFVAFLASIAAIPSSKTTLQRYTVH